ncbi:MAG TPA: DNRLRE domain-containing protein, partial [Candidatus Goldiibacteriota bacterium]|nr:DNRLRE domain-containing protein [Candidatus Goldiibacteriota bacterium]
TDNSGDSVGSNTYTAYAISRSWTEGTGACGGGGIGVNVSWNNFDGTGNAWTAPGGDFSVSAASNAVPVTTVANGTEISFNLNTSMVQSWISSPSTNYGIIIKDSATTGDKWLRPCSSEIAGTAYRPKLTVNYTLQ